MTNVSRPDVPNAPTLESDADIESLLEHVIAEYEDGPSACTMYPRHCSNADIATHWITAEKGSYVDLSERR